MKINLSLIFLSLILLSGCNKKSTQTNSSTADTTQSDTSESGVKNKFAGNWLCKDYLDALRFKRNAENLDVIDLKPDVWELVFSPTNKDTVVVYAESGRQTLPVKYFGTDSLLINLRNGKKLLFVYDKYLDRLMLKRDPTNNIKKVKPDYTYDKANVKYLYVDAGLKNAFSQAVNENTLANEYWLMKDGKVTADKVNFRFDGSVIGLADFDHYAVCYADPCMQMLKGRLQNVVYLTSQRKSVPYAWRISGDYDTLFIYSIQNNMADQLKYKLVVTNNKN